MNEGAKSTRAGYMEPLIQGTSPTSLDRIWSEGF